MNKKRINKKSALSEMMKYLLLAVFLITWLFSCVSNKAPDIHTPEINMSWPGTYKGITPAADCPGIDVQIVLNYDKTYGLWYKYIDRDNSAFYREGTFTWDKTGRIVILNIKDFPPYYMAAENRLIQLDMKGNKITGDLADNYILEKID
jgi:uncharacterized lipoprotein NlpE involved in copper resistance